MQNNLVSFKRGGHHVRKTQLKLAEGTRKSSNGLPPSCLGGDIVNKDNVKKNLSEVSAINFHGKA